MKLNKKQFCIAVNTFKEMMEEENDLINALDISPEWKPGHWINNYYELLEEVCSHGALKRQKYYMILLQETINLWDGRASMYRSAVF